MIFICVRRKAFRKSEEYINLPSHLFNVSTVLVIIKRKILKALCTDKSAKTRRLVSRKHECTLHAIAHFHVDKSRVSARLALVVHVGIILGVAVSAKQSRSVLEQRLVAALKLLNRRLDVASTRRDYSHYVGSRSRKNAVDILYLGNFGVKLKFAIVRRVMRL